VSAVGEVHPRVILLYSVLADYRKFKWRINTSAYNAVTYYYQPLITIYPPQRIWWLLQH